MKPRNRPLAEDASSWASPSAAARRCLLAVGLIVGLIGVAIGAAFTARSSPALPYFELCALVPVVAVVMLELRPAVVAVRSDLCLGDRRAIRRFRRQLDALPETRHPLGA